MADHRSEPGQRLDRAGLQPVFGDDFAGPQLDPARWVDHYLPQWTTPERSAARYRFQPDGLRLLVEADQPGWRTDEPLRVSNLQTGSFSGPAGSALGTHRHREGLTVVSPQLTRRLWLPAAGSPDGGAGTSWLVEARLSTSADPTCMLAIWLVGFEEASPQQSGEICVAELFGTAVGPEESLVRAGIKAHSDPLLVTDVADLPVPVDTSRPHTYAAEWSAERTSFYVDDVLLRTVEQGIAYPLQLMVDLFEFPEGGERVAAAYPKSAVVHGVRGYRRAREGLSPG